MLEETATVVAVEDDYLWVEAESRSACSQCSSGHCSTSSISHLFGVRRNRLQLHNHLKAVMGDQVVIGIPDQLLVRASVWGYLVPLLAMLMLTLMAHSWGVSEGWQILFAMTGLAGGFYSVRWSTRLNAQQFQPQLLRIETPAGVQWFKPKSVN